MQKMTPTSPDDEQLEPQDQGDGDWREKERQRDSKIDLKAKFRRLSMKQILVIKHRYFDDLTQDQTAERLGLTRDQVQTIEASALKKLRAT
jgi:RNA polymerase sigma factor (sigma-70 family)